MDSQRYVLSSLPKDNAGLMLTDKPLPQRIQEELDLAIVRTGLTPQLHHALEALSALLSATPAMVEETFRQALDSDT